MPGLQVTKMVRKGCCSNFTRANFSVDELISAKGTCGTNCPDKSIPDAEQRLREASPDILKGSRLVRVSASTNGEERDDSRKRWR